MPVRTIALMVAGAALSGAPIALCQAQNTPDLLQIRFDNESDPARRARTLIDMSTTDFHVIAQMVQSGNDDDALKLLQQFVDDAQKCSTQLDAKEANPEAHPGGFKQLQFATRESLRRLDDITVGLVGDEQTPFLNARKKIDELNRHLIRELFPHQPQPAEKAPTKGPDDDEAPAQQSAPR